MGMFKDDIINGVKHAIDNSKNLTQFAAAVNIPQPNLFRWVNGKSAPTLDKISAVMDYLGARVVFPWTRQETFFEDFNDKLNEMGTRIKELNEQIANYKVITEGYQQLLAAKK